MCQKDTLRTKQLCETTCANVLHNTWVFPKCFTEFADKNICHYSKRALDCHLLRRRSGCYHSTSKTHVSDRIFKLSPIHAWVIYQIPWICWIHWIQWKFCPIQEKLHCVSRRKDYIYLLDLDPIVNQTGGFILVEMLPVIIYGLFFI